MYLEDRFAVPTLLRWMICSGLLTVHQQPLYVPPDSCPLRGPSDRKDSVSFTRQSLEQCGVFMPCLKHLMQRLRIALGTGSWRQDWPAMQQAIRCGVMANIAVSHTAARGSIPRIGNLF
jgi:hypothetical protein